MPTKYIPVPGHETYIDTLIKKRKFAITGKIIDSIFFPEDDIFYENVTVRCKNAFI